MDNNDIKKTRIKKNSMTQKLLATVGEEKLKVLWVKYGCYKSAELLSEEIQQYVSFSTMRYLSQIKNWKRPVNKKSPIYKGVLAGTIPAAYYKHLIFPEEVTQNGKPI